MTVAVIAKNCLTKPLFKKRRIGKKRKETLGRMISSEFARLMAFFMVSVRKIGWVLHAIFAAITWAFLWFVTTFSG